MNSGKTSFRCAIFDLDGTLVDTVQDLASVLNRVIQERGFDPAPMECFIKMQGKTIEAQVSAMLPPEERNDKFVEELAAEARKFYEEEPPNLGKPYRGIQELLSALGRKKIKRAVLTNKPDRIANREIGLFFPAGSFDMVSGIRPGFPHKPDPASVWELLVELDASPRNTILIGDSEIDMQTAAAAGCFAVGVSWGYRDAAALKNAGAMCIINKPLELLEFL
ncbi:MAG: HAD family hydrolase [Treponema sp.]|nr:HAD family hydrolase [Treponema sp.]